MTKLLGLVAAGLLIAGSAAVLLTSCKSPAPVAKLDPNQLKINPKDGLPYVWIAPGKFTMGCSGNSCGSEEQPAHEVTLSQGFWLGQTEVTQEAYRKVIGTSPSHFRDAKLPVEQVTWDEAKHYCETAAVRLPTEAEWEYAARAGSTSDPGDLDSVAWTKSNSREKSHEVAQKQPNKFGLFDMLGNLWEFTADWYSIDYYERRVNVDPPGPTIDKPQLLDGHVLRGGSWYYGPEYARASRRGIATGKAYDTGFRCVGE